MLLVLYKKVCEVDIVDEKKSTSESAWRAKRLKLGKISAVGEEELQEKVREERSCKRGGKSARV